MLLTSPCLHQAGSSCGDDDDDGDGDDDNAYIRF